MSASHPPSTAIPWHRRLEARVIVSVTLVAGVSLAAVLFVTSKRVTQYALDRSATDIGAAREAFERLIDTRTEFAASEARLIAELPVFRSVMPLDSATIDQTARDYCRLLDADFCIVTNSEGHWIGRAGLVVDAQAPPLVAQIAEALQGKSVNDIFSWAGNLFLTVAEPARFDTEILGTFTVGYRLDDTVAAELAAMARCDVAFVCTGDRVCGTSLKPENREALAAILARNPDELGAVDSAPMLRPIGEAAYVSGVFRLLSDDPIDSVQRTSATRSRRVAGPSVRDGSSRLVLLQDWGPFEQTLARLHGLLGWVGFIAFGTAVASTLVFSRRLTRPVRDLAGAANEIAAGNWTRRMPVDGPAEARVMAEAFNQMTVTLRQREDQLRQAQKMEAVGRLAGGVAHDFNNLLTGILGYADLLLKRLPPGHDMRPDVEGIHKAGKSAATLTRDLLAFSRKQVLQPVVLDLNAVVSGTETLMRRLLGEDIDLTLKLAQGLNQVTADRAQIEQSLLNLAVNARDAMPGGGRLLIETKNATGDEAALRAHVPAKSGPYVLLRVSDTGQGMTDEVRAHLFEPFFTTKEVGKGTGLGLASVYGVVKQSAGHIWVESQPGQGAAFTIALPASRPVETPAEPRVERTDTARGGSETILLVEDNDAVRDLARDTLTRFGYEVIEAKNGVEALRIGTVQLDRIGLVVTDLVMPMMGGGELARRLKALRPDLKIIFTSGYAADALGSQGPLEPGAPFLQKPFTPAVLGQSVRDLLDRPPGA